MEESEHRLAKAASAAAYGVNVIVRRRNPRLAADLEQVVRHKAPLVIAPLCAVRDVVDAVHSYGGLVFHLIQRALTMDRWDNGPPGRTDTRMRRDPCLPACELGLYLQARRRRPRSVSGGKDKNADRT